MKVLHVPHAYWPVVGGAENICRHVSEILYDKGIDITVLTSDVGSVQGYYEWGVAGVSICKKDRVPVVRINYGGLYYVFGTCLASIAKDGSPLSKFTGRLFLLIRRRFMRRIMKRLVQIKPDVVMTMPHMVVNVLAVLESKRKDSFSLVMVPMLHEHDPNWDKRAVINALKMAESVVAMTDYERVKLEQEYEVDTRKIFVAGVGTELGDALTAMSDSKDVLFLGRKTEKKGIIKLLDAMLMVWKDHPDARLILAGPASSDWQLLEEKIKGLPASCIKNILDIDAVVGVEKGKLISSCRCLVLPSMIESFGMVLVEAWAYARPVITYDIPLFRSIVSNNIDGLLVDEKSVAALASGINELLRNKSKAIDFGLLGRKKVEDKYSWEKVASKYYEAYEFAFCKRNQLADSS